MKTMCDIENREDIIFLIDEFYKRVIVDPVIGHFFTRVVVLDWDKHIPIMYDFWESILFGKATYKGNPMIKHIELNKVEAIKAEHFERWMFLWKSTIDDHFVGEMAEKAINKATSIRGLMQYKIQASQEGMIY